MARLAELDSEGNTLGIGTVPPSAVLRQGSAGQDVVTLPRSGVPGYEESIFVMIFVSAISISSG